jgi:DNA-binding CsgD family transcriptional regulator
LPKNLPNAVKHLSDGELDLLYAAMLDEMNRRGRIPPGVETDLQASRHLFNDRPDLLTKRSSGTGNSHRRNVDIAEVPLTRGQVNAVRAAFKAGVTPSWIARQFGLSQANVRKALASDESKR